MIAIRDRRWVVDVTIAVKLCDEEMDSQQSRDRDSDKSLIYLERHLISEEFGMFEVALVKDKDVADGCECEVKKCTC